MNLVHSKFQSAAVTRWALQGWATGEMVKGKGIPWQRMESHQVIGLSRVLLWNMAVIRGVREAFAGTIKVDWEGKKWDLSLSVLHRQGLTDMAIHLQG